MPTEKKRVAIEADNLPANLTVGETCPAIYTAQGLFDKRMQVTMQSWFKC